MNNKRMPYRDPVNIILVTSGSRGQRLLFRYPSQDGPGEDSPPVTPVEPTAVSEDTTSMINQNPYKLILESENLTDYPKDEAVLINKNLFGYKDALLATILAPKHSLCNQNFQLKIGSVTFVGFPVLLPTDTTDCYDGCGPFQEPNLQEDVTIKMVHVVIAFQSSAIDSKTLANYHTISKMLGMALKHEEQRCLYLSKQRDIMAREMDRVSSLPEGTDENPFEAILAKSSLAEDLVLVFKSMVETGVIKVLINKWINLNFSLPHKVHRNAAKRTVLDAHNFANYINRIKPYHTFLLLGAKEKETLINSMPPDASPALIRLIKMYNPMKSFQVLSQDADISLPQIFQIVAHLVYWGKCNVIYPLAESNVYVISENAHTEVDCKYAEFFVREFPQKSLHSILARFSLPTTLGEYCNPLGNKQQQQEQVRIVTWLLKRRLLKQLHTYVYFMPQVTLHDEFSGETESFTFDELSMFKTHEIKIFRGLSLVERASVLQMLNQVERQDISSFLQMSKYMRGQHHLEEIMYYENVRRSDLLILIDKFRNMLITAQHEDLATSRILC